LEDVITDGTILKPALNKYDMRAWTRRIWLRTRVNGRSL
jgi:hypothetical protein